MTTRTPRAPMSKRPASRSCSPPARARACVPRGRRCCMRSPGARCSRMCSARCAAPACDAAAVVVGPDSDAVADEARRVLPKAEVFVQAERRGTAHAVLAARAAIEQGADDILVIFGDTPLISAETLKRAARRDRPSCERRGARLSPRRSDRLRPADHQRASAGGDPRGAGRERRRAQDRSLQRRR